MDGGAAPERYSHGMDDDRDDQEKGGVRVAPRFRWDLELPAWLADRWQRSSDREFTDDESKMRFAIELARTNVEKGTGGPFGSAVFERDSGRLVAPGVNLVTTARASIAHGEIVALFLAQQKLGNHDLGADGLPSHELFTSTEPCAMCLGSIPWSGITRIVCAASGADAEVIGFDEGAKPTDWVASLEDRGIEVVRGVLQADGKAVLQAYAAKSGEIY